jgi:hypothetical protein
MFSLIALGAAWWLFGWQAFIALLGLYIVARIAIGRVFR